MLSRASQGNALAFLGSSRIKVTNTFLAICLVYPEYPALCQTLDAGCLT
jgi:hypothetical protein